MDISIMCLINRSGAHQMKTLFVPVTSITWQRY